MIVGFTSISDMSVDVTIPAALVSEIGDDFVVSLIVSSVLILQWPVYLGYPLGVGSTSIALTGV